MLVIKASQKLFLDTALVLKKLSRAEYIVAMRHGPLIRAIARRSMRKVNKKGEPSKPGQPPKERLGHLKRGRYGVTFGWDVKTRSVVVGPEKFMSGRQRTDDTGPATLEYGGNIQVNESVRKDGSWSRRGVKWAKLNGQKMRTRKAHIEPRPFMRPAEKKARPKLLDKWRNAMEKV